MIGRAEVVPCEWIKDSITGDAIPYFWHKENYPAPVVSYQLRPAFSQEQRLELNAWLDRLIAASPKVSFAVVLFSTSGNRLKRAELAKLDADGWRLGYDSGFFWDGQEWKEQV